MAEANIGHRIKRIYAAITVAEESNLELFEPIVMEDGDTLEITQDFQGTLNQEELANLAYSIIHNIANLRDHVRRLVKTRGINVSSVTEIFESSIEIRIIQDLSNNDKHGYPPRNGGKSGLSPKLGNIKQGLQITAFDEGGRPSKLGVVVSGEIFDAEGNPIGNLYLVAKKAVEVWEQFLASIGITT